MFEICIRKRVFNKYNGEAMSENEELRIVARKKALQVAKTFGWPLGGKEYQDEYNDILENLIRDKVRRENESKARPL
jgi:non-homologous end joining protein Ku